MRKQAIYSAPINAFWGGLSARLKEKYKVYPAYWVGAERKGERHPDCIYHDVWEAFKLESLPVSVSAKGLLSFDNISVREYAAYLKILDRVDFLGSFSFSERDRLLKEQYDYWMAVIDEQAIDLLLMSNVPHMPYDYPLYLAAKHKNIRIVFFNVVSFKGWTYLSSEVGAVGPVEVNSPGEADGISVEFAATAVDALRDDKYVEPWYMAAQRLQDFNNRLRNRPLILEGLEIIKAVRRLPRHGSRAIYRSGKIASIKKVAQPYSGARVSLLDSIKLKRSGLNLQMKWLREYEEEVADVALETTDYVFVPLHYQPEATTAPLGEEFVDQIYMVETLSRLLPDRITILVKEHYSQFSSALHGYQGRYSGYWKKLASIPKVKIVGLDVPSKVMIKNALAVATVTGTAGWEALVQRKPCILFGGAWYQQAPGVLKFDSKTEAHELEGFLESPGEIDLKEFSRSFCRYAFKTDAFNEKYDEGASSPASAAEKISIFLGL